MAKNIAVLGTASDVGKSISTTALCRIFYEMGFKVAPYKAQNMSNNSFVSLSQGELARAQAVQAEAAHLEPTVDMNPILLKPSSDSVAQVIVHGKVLKNSEAKAYFSDTSFYREQAFLSLDRLNSQFDMVVIEGAGSCAEMNLRASDFTNFAVAHHANASVILVADIDKGGVFAQIIGTLDLLEAKDRALVKGIIINRFRGDASLFADGIKFIEERTQIPVLGLIPYFKDIHIDSEDGLPLDALVDPKESIDKQFITIAVLLLPHISNFTDVMPLIDPLTTRLHFLRRVRSLGGYDLVLIPGSKNVRRDLSWLHSCGWSDELKKYREEGGNIGGICGGYQILGEKISDPEGIEDAIGESIGLGMLPIETTLCATKQVCRSEGKWIGTGQRVSGYEIHHGITRKTSDCGSLIRIDARDGHQMMQDDGALSDDKKVWGCYMHGLFDSPAFRAYFLNSISNKKIQVSERLQSSYDDRQHNYHLLAEHFRAHLDLAALRLIIESI